MPCPARSQLRHPPPGRCRKSVRAFPEAALSGVGPCPAPSESQRRHPPPDTLPQKVSALFRRQHQQAADLIPQRQFALLLKRLKSSFSGRLSLPQASVGNLARGHYARAASRSCALHDTGQPRHSQARRAHSNLQRPAPQPFKRRHAIDRVREIELQSIVIPHQPDQSAHRIVKDAARRPPTRPQSASAS
jgi:hypothetical protein